MKLNRWDNEPCPKNSKAYHGTVTGIRKMYTTPKTLPCRLLDIGVINLEICSDCCLPYFLHSWYLFRGKHKQDMVPALRELWSDKKIAMKKSILKIMKNLNVPYYKN